MIMKSFTDKALLKAEDEQFAFRILYDKYWESLFKKAACRLGNEDDARDVVQEIFISLWRNRQSIEVEETLAPYLFTALKYAIIKLVYKKAKKKIIVPLSVIDLENYFGNTDGVIEYRELRNLLEKEVAVLPERMRQIYYLSRVEHLQAGEIARRLNLSKQTVKNTLTLTLKRLKSKVLIFCLLPGFFFFF
jgi:RNA polymerase sigma factor (sigma-70 family)